MHPNSERCQFRSTCFSVIAQSSALGAASFRSELVSSADSGSDATGMHNAIRRTLECDHARPLIKIYTAYEFSWSHFIALWSLLKGEIHLLILLRCVVSSHHDIYFSHLSCLIIFQKPANSLPTTHFIGPNWSNNASEKVVRSIKGSAIWPHVSDSYGYYLELDIRASPTRIACNGA